MITRCKFVCYSVKENHTNIWKDGKPIPTSTFEYEFSAVTSGSEENKSFFAATPTGTLKFATTNGPKRFEAGQEYYIDVVPTFAPVEV